jgi:histidine ammonia-lyase
MDKIILTGSNLKIEDIVAIGLGDRKIELCEEALTRCYQSRRFLEQQLRSKKIIYGVNTSYGPMCNKIIPDDKLDELQINLIKSHAAGLGKPLRSCITLAAMVVRLNTLVKGYSGVRVELLRHMQKLINHGVAPYIPECGSVGASGDLVHLAHLALSVIGEGEVFFAGEIQDVKAVYQQIDMVPFKLKFKEGIALINGTSVMTAIAAFAVYDAKQVLNVGQITAAFAYEIFSGINDALDEDLHWLKPHPGQIAIAEQINKLIAGSKNIVTRDEIHKAVYQKETGHEVFETNTVVQDAYSLRCTAQILAPAKETIDNVAKVVECEANSANDNPLIFPEKNKIIHGGNFHGQSIGCAMDMLSIAICIICGLSERRTNKLVDRNLNLGLPEHLIIGTAGLSMGLMGAQYLATSTTAENRQLANPVSTLSISCNASNQDVVSMGTIAARKALQSVDNAKHILTVEVLADLQALSLRNASTMGCGINNVYQILLPYFSAYDNSRVLHNDLVKLRAILFDRNLFNNLSHFVTKGFFEVK